MTIPTGIGSWPGDDVRTALRVVRDVLAEPASDGARGLPYLPELPARGPGADMIGRAASLLVELPVDLQPSGWRLVDRPGRDVGRARTMLRSDLDDLAEAFDGYAGPLKVQVTGPWTLAAQVRLARGERVVADAGAARDLGESLAEGVRAHVREVARLVPGADVVVQLDEPSLPSVIAGRLPTSSGYGMHRAVDAEVVRAGLRVVTDAARDAGADRVAVHCCAPDVPVPLLRGAGADAVALDVTLLDGRGWEHVGEAVEAGTSLWAGLPVDPAAARRSVADVTAPLEQVWHRLGLDRALLDAVVLTPTCGLAGSSPDQAVAIHRLLADAARSLHERVAEG